MIRQLNLIIALINDPKIVFLDEPTVGMDPRARRKTWEFIGDLKQQDKTIILTTHYIYQHHLQEFQIVYRSWTVYIDLYNKHLFQNFFLPEQKPLLKQHI